MKHKIALFVPSLRGGGAERVVVNLANFLVKLGLSVDVLVCSREGPYNEALAKDVGLVDFRVGRVVRSLPYLVEYLKSQKPVALISSLTHCNIIALSAKKAVGGGTKIIIINHNLSSLNKNEKFPVKAAATSFISRFAYPWADHVVAVSEAVRQDLLQINGRLESKIVKIYNPVFDEHSIDNLSSEAVTETIFKCGRRTVIAVGRLSKQKNFDNLIKAFPDVLKTVEAQLVIIGEGPERRNLEGLIRGLNLSNSCHLIGFKENPYKYIKSSQLLVLPSESEGFGNVLVEALRLGVPVVSTAISGGPSEILEEGKWGILANDSSSASLCDAIILGLLSPKPVPERSYLSKYSIENVVMSYHRLIEGTYNEL